MNKIIIIAAVVLFLTVAALWIIRLRKKAKWKHYIESQNK